MAACAVRFRQWWRVHVDARYRAVAAVDMDGRSVAKLTLEMLQIGLPTFMGMAAIDAAQKGRDPLVFLIGPITAIIAIYLLSSNMLRMTTMEEKIEALEKGHNDLRSAFEQHVAQYEKDKKEITGAIERLIKEVAELRATMASGFERIGKEMAEQRSAIERIEKDIADLKSWRSEQMAHRCDRCGRSAT